VLAYVKAKPDPPNTFPAADFAGAACVVALVDRFNQHCHREEALPG
jgi:hypothetical protein